MIDAPVGYPALSTGCMSRAMVCQNPLDFPNFIAEQTVYQCRLPKYSMMIPI
jgi:hypothetical protein